VRLPVRTRHAIADVHRVCPGGSPFDGQLRARVSHFEALRRKGRRCALRNLAICFRSEHVIAPSGTSSAAHEPRGRCDGVREDSHGLDSEGSHGT